MHSVSVAAASKGVELPDGHQYDGPITVILSDDLFNQIGAHAFVSGVLVDNGAVAGSGQAFVWRRKTGAYTALIGDFVACDTTTAPWTLLTPTPAVNAYFSWKLIAGANNITVQGAGGSLIDGSNTTVTNVLYNAGSLISDGANWFNY